jgi:hypothetical protein
MPPTKPMPMQHPRIPYQILPRPRADVLGLHEVPDGPQHVRTQDGAVVEERGQIALIRVLRARGHRPGRLTGGSLRRRPRRTDNLARRDGVG